MPPFAWRRTLSSGRLSIACPPGFDLHNVCVDIATRGRHFLIWWMLANTPQPSWWWSSPRSRAFTVVSFASPSEVYSFLNGSVPSANYASTFDNPYTWLWIIASIVSSCYAYTWDIKMDWGLFDKNAGENTFLREEVVYSSTVSWITANKYKLESTIYP